MVRIETAMVFAAGFGTRMRPLTLTIPKPLVKVGGKALLDYRLDALVRVGVKRAVVNTHYLPEQIHQHLENRRDIEIIISYEEEILETGGGMVRARKHLGDDPIFVMNSDVIWLDRGTPALERLMVTYDSETMDILMLLHPCAKAVGYDGTGDFDLTEDDGSILGKVGTKAAYVYTGVQIMNPHILDSSVEKKFSLSQIFRQHFDYTSPLYGRMHGIVHQGDWLHVDSSESLKEAENFLRHQC